jgi:hypothetical protein
VATAGPGPAVARAATFAAAVTRESYRNRQRIKFSPEAPPPCLVDRSTPSDGTAERLARRRGPYRGEISGDDRRQVSGNITLTFNPEKKLRDI